MRLPAFLCKVGGFCPGIIIEKRVEERDMTKKVLVITDAQNEFITGALGNKECEAAVKYIVAAAESGEYYKVIFTKDTHTADYLHTQEGKVCPFCTDRKAQKDIRSIRIS